MCVRGYEAEMFEIILLPDSRTIHSRSGIFQQSHDTTVDTCLPGFIDFYTDLFPGWSCKKIYFSSVTATGNILKKSVF